MGRAQSSVRTTKIQAQFSAQTTRNRAQFGARTTKSSLRVNDQNSGTIQHANETRSGHNCVGDRLSENTKTAIICITKVFFFLNSTGRYINRAGREGVRAGRSTLRNTPSWISFSTSTAGQWKRTVICDIIIRTGPVRVIGVYEHEHTHHSILHCNIDQHSFSTRIKINYVDASTFASTKNK